MVLAEWTKGHRQPLPTDTRCLLAAPLSRLSDILFQLQELLAIHKLAISQDRDCAVSFWWVARGMKLGLASSLALPGSWRWGAAYALSQKTDN